MGHSACGPGFDDCHAVVHFVLGLVFVNVAVLVQVSGRRMVKIAAVHAPTYGK
jgi:hypothetical protein